MSDFFSDDGILLVNKPKDWTSHDVCNCIRGRFKIKKVGHCGTLDPLATGLLVVVTGKATKLSQILSGDDKTYRAEMTLGTEMDSQDSTGKVVAEESWEDVDEELLRATFPRFEGEQQQLPPMFSAVKKNGKKLYELARKGIEVEREPRTINITDLEITTKTQLIHKLEELARFQKLGQRLMTLPKRDEDIFVKPKVDRKAIQNSILLPMDLDSLTNVMVDMIRQNKRKYTAVKRDRLSIKEKLIHLSNNLKVGTNTTMDKLIDWKAGKEEIVITFISLLELARLQKLNIFQNEPDGDVYVDVIKELSDFDVQTANGFDPEEEDDSVSEEDLVPPVPVMEAVEQLASESTEAKIIH